MNSSLPRSSHPADSSLRFLLIGFSRVLPKNVPSRENYRPVNSCVILGMVYPLGWVKITVSVNKPCVCEGETFKK